MADIDFGSDAANSMASRMLMTDMSLQQDHPNWPTGGTAAQIHLESRGNNNAVSPAGAIGIAQFEPSTFDAVKKQMGRPGMDIHNVNDQMDAHQFLMHQNLDRADGDVAGGLSLYNSGRLKTDNPETTGYIKNFSAATGGANNGKIDFGDGDAPAAKQDIDFGDDKPDDKSAMDNIKGLGLQVANLVGGGVEGLPIAGAAAIGLGRRLIGGQGLSGALNDTAVQAGQNFHDLSPENGLNKLGVNTADLHNTAGYQGPQAALDFAFDTAPKWLGKQMAHGIAAGDGGGMPVGPQDEKDMANLVSAGLIGLPLIHAMKGKPSDAGAADELDKLNAAGAPEGPGTGGGTPMGANEGPQRGAFTVDPSGNVDTGLPTDEATFWAQRADQMQKDAQAAQGAQMSPNDGPQLPGGMGANAGPQIPAAEMQARQAAQAAQMGPNAGPQFQPNAPVQTPFDKSQPDMFGGFPQDYAGPQAEPSQYIPDNVRQALGMPLNKDESPTGTRNLRQQQLDFSQRLGSDSPYNVDAAGNVKTGTPLTPDQQAMSATMAKSRAFGDHPNSGPQLPEGARESANRGPQIEPDVLQQRQQQMREMTGKQLDIFGDQDNAARPFDQRIGDSRNTLSDEHAEVPRSLSSDEFEETIQNLADKDGTRFQVPGLDDPARGPFMDAAYEHYTDMLHDDHGGLFDRPTIAKNFADAALKDSIERRVKDHPTVKANIKRVADAQARVDNVGDRSPQAAKDALTKAQNTLQKSVDNIGAHFKDAAKATAPWEKDGIVYMNTFGDMGTMMKSIGAVLKGIHGVVFKTLNKMMPSVKNLDSTKQIFGQGIRDAINKQATRTWETKVNERPVKSLDKIAGMRKALDAYDPFEAQHKSDAELKSMMLEANDINDSLRNSGLNHVLQGGMQLSSFYRHPLVKYVTETMDRAQRNTKAYVRDNLLGKDGLRTKMQALTSDKLTSIYSLMQLNEGKREFSPAELKSQGYDAKQIDFYSKNLELEDQAFKLHNEGRANAGLPPVDRRIGHIAGYFMGDWKTVIRDPRNTNAMNPTGVAVGVVTHNFRQAVGTLTKRFLENHPDGEFLKADKPELNKLKESGVGADNRFHGYMEVLNMMQHNDTNMATLVKTYKDFLTNDAMAAMANRSKFKSKEGVIGAEGRKSWQSAQENAKDGAKQQLRYLESVTKWSENQKALAATKKFLADPDITEKAPNASKLAATYQDAVQGRNQGVIAENVNGLINGFAQATGIGPSVLKGMNNGLKTAVLAKFVGILKLSHSAVTMLQPILGMPFTNALMRSRGLDIPWMHGTAVSSVAKAMHSVFQMTTKVKTGDPFMDAAKDYMKQNGTADVGMSNHYKNVTAESKTGERIGNAMHANVSIPEAGARSFSFMYYSHLLKDMGLPADEIFPTAHNAMREVMVDYAAHERPMMFGKLSLLGDIASTLTRFKFNTVGKHLIAAGDVQRDGMSHVMPLVHMIGASIAGAGIRGVFAYEAANQAIKLITQAAASAGLMKNSTSLNELVLNAFHDMTHRMGVDKHGNQISTQIPNGNKYHQQGMSDVLNWGGMAGIGINMTGSLSNSDTIPMDPMSAFIPGQGELSGLGSSIANLVTHHNSQSAKQFAFNVLTPNSLKGVVENAAFTDKDGKFFNPQTGMLETKRSPIDQVKRDFSFRPLDESKKSLVARTLNNAETGDTENGEGNFTGTAGLKHDFLERAKSDILSNGGKVDPVKMQAWGQRYTQAGGDPDSFQADMESFLGKGRNMDRLQRAEGIPSNNIGGINRYIRGKEMEQ